LPLPFEWVQQEALGMSPRPMQLTASL